MSASRPERNEGAGKPLRKILLVGNPNVGKSVIFSRLTGEGIRYLHQALSEAAVSPYDYDDNERWHDVGNIVEKVQQITHRHHTLLERLGDLSIKPASGLPIAFIILLAAFEIIRFMGEGLITWVFDPLFLHLWKPLILKLSGMLQAIPFLHNILIGNLTPGGDIEFVEAFGLLTTGLYVPLAMILPYIFAFFLILEIPPYRMPYFPGLFKKLMIRTDSFLMEAVPFVIAGVLVVNVLYTLKIMDFLAVLASPVFENLLGLPGDTAPALIIGFLRKDVAVGMLAPLGLSLKQLIIASVVLAMYFPCLATFIVMIKEMGVKDMLQAMLIMGGSTLVVGMTLNFLL